MVVRAQRPRYDQASSAVPRPRCYREHTRRHDHVVATLLPVPDLFLCIWLVSSTDPFILLCPCVFFLYGELGGFCELLILIFQRALLKLVIGFFYFGTGITERSIYGMDIDAATRILGGFRRKPFFVSWIYMIQWSKSLMGRNYGVKLACLEGDGGEWCLLVVM